MNWDGVWVALAVANIFAVIILMVDHIQYPGAGTPIPDDIAVLRGVAFFILVVTAAILVLLFLANFRTLYSKSTGAFAFLALNGCFFIACFVYLLVYEYGLSASAQAGSAASNFFYVAMVDVALVVVTTLFSSCFIGDKYWAYQNYYNSGNCVQVDVLSLIFDILMAFH